MSIVSNPKTVLVVAGTRPEVIKLAPVVKECKSHKQIRTVFCLTGQHKELADDVLAFFGLEVDYRLNVMRENQDLNHLTARVMNEIRPVLHKERPEVVVVQGDTITCFAAGLAAFLERIPICHVEAGLRTYDLSAPFPEEALRQMVTRIATLHCAATPGNLDNLLAEGIANEKIVVTGNTVIDALYWARDLIVSQGPSGLGFTKQELKHVESYRRMVLVTGHRREHFGEKLTNICCALAECANKHQDVLFIYPVHPNPNVTNPVRKILGGLENAMLLKPLNYPEFIYLMNRSYLVVTDSGGVQEEAPALGKPVLVTRDDTERKEALSTGQVLLTGTSKLSIIEALDQLLSLPTRHSQMVRNGSPYGDGRAANRIVAAMVSLMECNPTQVDLSAHPVEVPA